jgi:ABC-2 type transport system ATP-binding protein
VTGGPAPAGIVVRDLERRFGALTAVAGISFTVHPGELFGLVGPDGAGKTTTLRMLAGVLKPTAGDAEIAGLSVAREPERVKPAIAYMSQRFGLYADLTVAENLEFYADLYRVPAAERGARLERLYAFSNLAPFRDRLAGRLSGGMKQKLGLSCALIHRPQVLLLDEPTFGVDPISRRDLWLIVHEMVSEGTTAVISTAYMDEAERFDRVLLLDHGRMLALDTPAALAQSVPGELRAIAVEPVRRARDVARALPGVRSAAIFGHELHLAVDSWARDGDRIAGALRAAGIAITGSRPIAPTIEDVLMDRLSAGAQAGAGSAATNSDARGQ